MEAAWLQAWKDLPQEQIEKWIEATPHHMQEIIRLEGGNEYKESAVGCKRSWARLRLKGQLSKTYVSRLGEYHRTKYHEIFRDFITTIGMRPVLK